LAPAPVALDASGTAACWITRFLLSWLVVPRRRERNTAVNRDYARIFIVGCAAVLTAIAGGAIALAAVTWTVQPGGSFSATSGSFTIADTKTGAMLTCSSSKLTGTLKSGSGLPGTGIGSITAVGITACGSLGSYTVTATGLPWHVNFSRYNATEGIVTGSISHVRLRIAGNPFSCHAVVDGTSGTARDGITKFRYTNSSAVLKAVPAGGNLHFYRIADCAGIILPGDPATLSATFAVSPQQVITSP
jgi:hypothetical protein